MKKIFVYAILCAACAVFAAESSSALLKQAGNLVKSKKYDEAEQVYRKAVAAAKNSDEAATALYRRAEMFKQLKRYDEALAGFEAILSVKNLTRHNRGTALRALAQVRMLQGKTRDAIRYYKAAGAVNAGTWIDNTANAELAAICEKLGWYEDALAAHKACSQAVKCTPEAKVSAYAGMVLALAKLSRFEEAHAVMEQLNGLAGTLKNNNAAVIRGMAEARLADAEKEWNKAIEAYRAVMALPKIHYSQRRAAANRAAAIALHELKQIGLAKSIVEELRKTDKYGADEELLLAIKKGVKK